MSSSRMQLALYVDRSSRRWVVEDRDGRFWSLEYTGASWDDRQPFHWTKDVELERVPGHYRALLRLPC